MSTVAAKGYREGRWSRAVRVKRSGAVLEPAYAFDVTVPPGKSVQAAVDACPPGGCVLLLPGTHNGPLALAAGKVVHVFGRGRATLRTAAGDVISSAAAASTLDGLIVRTDAHTAGDGHFGIFITAGKLRVQACDVSSQSRSGIRVEGPTADPFIVDCRVHHCARAGISLFDGCQGTVKDCTCVYSLLGAWEGVQVPIFVAADAFILYG